MEGPACVIFEEGAGGLQRALHFGTELTGKKKTALTSAAANCETPRSFAERRDMEISHQVS